MTASTGMIVVVGPSAMTWHGLHPQHMSLLRRWWRTVECMEQCTYVPVSLSIRDGNGNAARHRALSHCLCAALSIKERAILHAKLEDCANRAEPVMTSTAHKLHALGGFYRLVYLLCLNNCTEEQLITYRFYRDTVCFLSGPSSHDLGGCSSIAPLTGIAVWRAG